jgi:carboxypeptidase C (cathepsin A)
MKFFLLTSTTTIISLIFLQPSPIQSLNTVNTADDNIQNLPGWNENTLPSKWYSGYLDAGTKDNGKYHLYHHYILVESESPSPDKDPVLVFTNGGPGASSLFGLFVELGPLLLDGDKLIRNPLSWNQHANLLIINGPPPVGFSYCTPAGPGGDFKSCGDWDDGSTAKHNALAILDFVHKFPRFKSSEWLFTGESYGGIYIPTLVQELLFTSKKTSSTTNTGNSDDKLNIRGMLIINGCVGTDVLCWAKGDGWWRVLFLRGHAQISEKGFYKFYQECGTNYRISQPTPECEKKAKELEEKECGSFFEYDVYSQCASRDWRLRGSFCNGDEDLAQYTARSDVKKALNVDVNAKFLSGDNGVGFNYKSTEKDVRPIYLKFLSIPNVRVVIMSGDTDVSVNVVATQNWTESLGLKEINSWRPWSFDPDFVAGHVVRYEKGFELVTVRGSGHMVPQFKSRAAFEILKNFLRKKNMKDPLVPTSDAKILPLYIVEDEKNEHDRVFLRMN